MLILDVDGTQTDGYVYYGLPEGPLKRFYVRDGQGVTNIQRLGVIVVFVSGDISEATALRAKRLSVEECLQGIEDKATIVRGLLLKHDLSPDEAAYMGDEPGDIEAMDEVGLAIAPANAVAEVVERADWVTQAAGGNGAVREVCDAIVAARQGE